MPRFKGSCGCYNRNDARELGLIPAIVWNDMLDRSEHFDANPMWYDQKDAAERLGIPERSLYRAVDKLVEAGRITKKKGYRPNTTTTTTWITINEGGESADQKLQFGEPGTTLLAVPRNCDLAVPIYKDTKKDDTELATATTSSHMKPSALVQAIARELKERVVAPKNANLAIQKLQAEMSDEDIMFVIRNRRKFKIKRDDGTEWMATAAWIFNPNKTSAFINWASIAIGQMESKGDIPEGLREQYDIAIELGEAESYEECEENWGMILPRIKFTKEYERLTNGR